MVLNLQTPKVTSGKMLAGLSWKFAERVGAQLVGFIISLCLAQVLDPTDYGLLSLITIFVALANVFVTSGFGTALMQKKNADELDFSSIFYFQIAMSVVLYIALFFSAPAIAGFYENEQLIAILRVYGIFLIISGVNNVQHAFVSKTLQFKRFFLSTLIGTVVSGGVGIAMAYNGYGVWALVAQQIINALMNTVVLWFTVKWRPILKFSIYRVKGLFSFGWKLLLSSLIDVGYTNLYGLLIGKIYNPESLGLYTRGNQFPSLIVNNLNGPIQSVLLPSLSTVQDNQGRAKSMVRRSIKTSTYIIFPLLMGMAAVATPMVHILLPEHWWDCIPFVRISCITMAFWPIHTTNLQSINALGRSDIFLKLEIIKKVIGLLVLFVTIPFGLYAMVIGRAISSFFSSFINAAPNKKLLNYSYLEQVKDMAPSILLSLVMGAFVLSIEFLNLNMYLTLGIQVLVGMAVYIGLSKLFKLEAFTYLFSLVTTKISSRKKKG